jgi:hypothetical protein
MEQTIHLWLPDLLPDLVYHPQTYLVIMHGIPTTFPVNNPEHDAYRALHEANDDHWAPDDVSHIEWINPNGLQAKTLDYCNTLLQT